MTSTSSARNTGATLVVDDVVMQFGGVRALDGVSLRIDPGEIVGLIGPNGSGKSTLINCISGVLSPTSGSIVVDGQDMTGWSRTKRAKFGLIRTYQNLRLFGELSGAENVEVASLLNSRIERPRTHAAGILREQHLTRVARTRVSDLDYGSQRQVEITRALAATPRFLAMDEPAAGLGEQDTHNLIATLEEFATSSGASILLVDHDMHLVASVSDRIIVLNQGTVLMQGPPREVLSDSRVAEVYLGSGTHQ